MSSKGLRTLEGAFTNQVMGNAIDISYVPNSLDLAGYTACSRARMPFSGLKDDGSTYGRS